MGVLYDTQTIADTIVKDLSSQIDGKVILTTGASPGGLGAFFNEQIACAKPNLLILASRNPSKNQATADLLLKDHPGLRVKTVTLDLEDLQNVRDAASTINAWSDVSHIDILVNNAGIMACEYAKTGDGIERQFAAGHVGHFLFTNLIMAKILASKSPRVVVVSSDGHGLSAIRWPDIGFSVRPMAAVAMRAYGQAKTANILFATALADKLGKKGLTSVSLHPGVIGTNLGGHLDWNTEFAGLQAVDKELGNNEGWREGFDFKTPERGVATHVYAAFEPSLKGKYFDLELDPHNGAYVLDSHIADPRVDTIKSYAQDKLESQKLWTLSEELVGQRFDY